MTPYLGKGATSAIADALSLAEHVEKLTPSNKAELSSILDDYTAGMLKSGFKMANMSKVVHNLVFMGSNPFKAKCRNALLRTMGVFIGNKDGSRIA
jgi:salicylate hydroxylase